MPGGFFPGSSNFGVPGGISQRHVREALKSKGIQTGGWHALPDGNLGFAVNVEDRQKAYEVLVDAGIHPSYIPNKVKTVSRDSHGQNYTEPLPCLPIFIAFVGLGILSVGGLTWWAISLIV